MFGRIGQLVTRHPWQVIAVWVVAAAALLAFAPGLAEVTTGDQGSFVPKDRKSVV